MQNQKSCATVLPLLARDTGVIVTNPYAKSDVIGYAIQVDTVAATDGSTLAIQIQHSLDGILWHNLDTATSITTSSTVKGALVQGTTIAPMVRASITLGVNNTTFSVIAYAAGV
jgi:hypothetical protein